MNRNQIIKILVGAAVIFIVFRILCARSKLEKFEGWSDASTWETVAPGTMMATPQPIMTAPPVPQQMVTSTPGPLATSVSLLPQVSPSPKPGQASWSEFAPQSLDGQMLLDPVKYIGVDTQGSTLKNASWDLRRDPPIPRQDVGPFLNSTYEADPWKKPLDDCS
jgi:hypothetical protein